MALNMETPLVPSQQRMEGQGMREALGDDQGAQADLRITDRCGPCLSKALFGVCCWNPLAWAGCLTKLDQNEQRAVLYWGVYTGTLQEPGIHCLNPCGREYREMSSKCSTMELKDIKVVDGKGNPVIISGVVTYFLTSAKKACVDVERPAQYITLQASATLKQVASQYSYTSTSGEPSLQTGGSLISGELIRLLQEKTSFTGAQILNFEIVDLSYAPEIAQVMLARQQAEALVEARRLFVGAAVDMVNHAVVQLESKGLTLSDSARENITGNLLTVVCSHTPASPTIPLSSSGSQ